MVGVLCPLWREPHNIPIFRTMFNNFQASQLFLNVLNVEIVEIVESYSGVGHQMPGVYSH